MTKEEFDSIPTIAEYLILQGIEEEVAKSIEEQFLKEYPKAWIAENLNVKPMTNGPLHITYIDIDKELFK